MRTMILAVTLAAAFASATDASASGTNGCNKKARAAARMIYSLNNEGKKISAHAELTDRSPSESGMVLTWLVNFSGRAENTETPYQIRMIEEGCYIFSITMPNAG